MPPPEIPARISSLIPAHRRKVLDQYSSRKTSITEKLRSASNTTEFIEAKAEELDIGIEENVQAQALVQECLKAKSLTADEYQAASSELKHKRSVMTDESRVIKRQKRALVQDIEEDQPSYATISEAYTSAISTKVMAASANMKSEMVFDRKSGKIVKKKFDKKGFKERVMERYAATREGEEDGAPQSYCLVSGWQAAENVSAAHLVPKSLSSGELLYLFDVEDDSMLGDSRNGIPLHTKLENALDNGKIVIVPVEMQKGESITRWKIVVTDKSILNNEVVGPQPLVVTGGTGKKWREIDGQELKFLNSNRPGQRYLYFRFVVTICHMKEEGLSLQWLEGVGPDARKTLWCTPGPYLRQSMLKVLASQCGLGEDRLSENLLENTFKGPDDEPPAEEKKKAVAMRVNIKDAFFQGSSSST